MFGFADCGAVGSATGLFRAVPVSGNPAHIASARHGSVRGLPRVSQSLQRLMGMFVIGFGVKLALSK